MFAALRPHRRPRSAAKPVHGWDEGSLYTLREQASDAHTGQTWPGHEQAHGKHRARINSRQTEE